MHAIHDDRLRGFFQVQLSAADHRSSAAAGATDSNSTHPASAVSSTGSSTTLLFSALFTTISSRSGVIRAQPEPSTARTNAKAFSSAKRFCSIPV